MTAHESRSLVGPGDPAPVAIFNASGRSPFLLIGDHAGTAIPAALGTLGMAAADLSRHIACDIGVRGMGHALARLLDAAFIHQAYSRLVIDCNRDPASADAVPEVSDGTSIAGNRSITEMELLERRAAIHEPYQAAIASHAAVRTGLDIPNILVSLHSFTPVMNGESRPWHVGVLHGGGDAAFARRVLTALCDRDGLTVGDNEPYRMDTTDHTVPRHAFAAAVPYVELEVRQDLITDAAGQEKWAALLAEVLVAAQML
jgi:predicted N-formylglutamate amidohydrolase